jgi:Uma2 family endonuclease
MVMAQTTAAWTLEDLHRLPDDGNKYELVDGELFVTPAPSPTHEMLASTLHRIVDRYVEAHDLGVLFRPRSVIKIDGNEVEPDLMVRTRPATELVRWEDAPLPLLVVEVMSATTRRRDLVQKRAFYRRCGIAEYWIIDRQHRSFHVVRPTDADVEATTTLVWHPVGAAEPLTIDVAAYFRETIGE